jgi:serine protease Do
MKLARGLIKAIAMVGGACVTLLCLMSWIGVTTDSGWLRASGAVAVMVVVPLVLVELALRLAHKERSGGVATDVVALSYLGFALAYAGVAHGYTRPLLADEAHRLEDAGMRRTARATFFLAGGRDTPAPPEPAKPAVPAPAKPASPPPKIAELKPGDGKERTPAQIFSEFAPSVVTITIKTAMGDGGGTGFIIEKGGTIATNFHVIEHATDVKVKLMDGTVAKDVEVLAESQPLDLALLHVTIDKPLAPVALGDSDKVMVGERAVSIGNPLGLDHTLTDGLVSARRMLDGRKLIQMSTPISPGNSGGPLFNSRGEVIGVSTAGYIGGMAQNLNLAVPVNDLRSLLRTEYPGRHKIGDSAKPGAGRW